jgi:hypothetical protein
MRHLAAVFALGLAGLVWLPSAGFADEGLAIAHPPSWDQSLAITHATGAPLDAASQMDGSGVEENGSSSHYARARSNGGGNTHPPANDLPLAITTFSTSE